MFVCLTEGCFGDFQNVSSYQIYFLSFPLPKTKIFSSLLSIITASLPKQNDDSVPFFKQFQGSGNTKEMISEKVIKRSERSLGRLMFLCRLSCRQFSHLYLLLSSITKHSFSLFYGTSVDSLRFPCNLLTLFLGSTNPIQEIGTKFGLNRNRI